MTFQACSLYRNSATVSLLCVLMKNTGPKRHLYFYSLLGAEVFFPYLSNSTSWMPNIFAKFASSRKLKVKRFLKAPSTNQLNGCGYEK